MSDLPPPTSRRLTGVHFKSYVWPQILSYESVSLCKLCLLFFGPMNTSAICQFEKLCTFHLFAERGVQSGRDRGYVRARRQPSSFLGDENETYTKIIEEMASFQLYNFVSPLPNPPHMLSTFLLLLTTAGLCNCTRRGQSTGKCFLTIYTNSVLHLYISHFAVLLILVRSKLFTNIVGAVAEFVMYLQTQHHAVNFWILSSQKWPQIWRAWESLPAFSGTFTLNVDILKSVVLYPLLIYMLLPPDGWPFCWLCKNVKIELEKGFQLQKIWQFCWVSE